MRLGFVILNHDVENDKVRTNIKRYLLEFVWNEKKQPIEDISDKITQKSVKILHKHNDKE